ncbi:glycosyltransferase family 2 protein, partial [Candidatus Margulisiibacteriota bacterium]
NAEKHLAASIRSILTQSHKNLELVIINDGSTDSSEDIVRTFMNRDDRIKYLVQKHLGVAAARNKGLKAADGQWIAYLDSDDIAMTDRIERCLSVVYRIGEKCLVYGGWFRFKVEKNKFRILDYAKGYLDSFDIFPFQNKNQFICSTVMHHKDCIVKAGFFDENLKCEEDWDLWLRISDDHPVYQLDEALVFRRVGEHGDYLKNDISNKVVAECRQYVTEKRIKKLLEAYAVDTDSEIAKKIFFATIDIKDDKLRREVLERLESWRIFGTVSGLVKTAPKQAFELLEKYKNDKLIAHLIRDKIFDFSFSMADVTNEEFSFIKGVLESLITSE